MDRNYTNLLLASLTVSAALNASIANATDDRMWRYQVARPVDSVIQLESQPFDLKKKFGNDSLLWRAQVKTVSENRVFVLQPAARRYAKLSDTRLWREQIKPDPASTKQRIGT